MFLMVSYNSLHKVFSTNSTDCETLHKFQEVFRKYEIDIKYFVKNYFDGAANISGNNKGLSTRLK